MADNKNMELWRKYANPPSEALKAFNNGTFKGTDISPMWRIQCLTEEFGPCGIGWYAEIVDRWREEVADTVMSFVTIRLFIRNGTDWSAPIMATGGNKLLRKGGGVPSDEAYKMAYTDALGGACKMLGIGGAVYWEAGYSKYENDYVDPEPKPAPKKEPPKEPRNVVKPTPPVTQFLDEISVSDEESEFRAAALAKYGQANLDRACTRKFGTTFEWTPYEQLKNVLKV